MFPMNRRYNAFPQVVVGTSLIFISLLLVGCGGGSSDSSSPPASASATGTPGAEAFVGERLFVETRFAQSFKAYLDWGGNVNDTLPVGDPVMGLHP